jgi:glycosyltransferase involved in cell wall biosynthesis
VFRFAADVLGTLNVLGRRRSTLDVLVAYQTVIDGFLGVLARRMFRIPVLVAVRSEKEYRLERSRVIRTLSPWVFRHADRIAVQTETVRRELLEALTHGGLPQLGRQVQGKMTVIPNGISVGEAPPRTGDTVLYVGRLIEAKGVIHLVEAMRECPEDRLLVVGDGPEMERLKNASREQGNVDFRGRATRPELEDSFRRARMLVLPSVRDEGMPNVLMEAMARGIPVIATRNAGIPDLVKNGETGLLVEPGDSRALASAIRRISAEPGLAERLSRNAREEIRRYEWAKVLPAIEKELEEIVARFRDSATALR